MTKKQLRKKLALMLANLKKKRPYYCEVEFLESTGTQYIDTGLNYFADFEVGIKLRNNVANKALGNTSYNCMERNNATDHNWRFSSNGSYDSNIDILEYHVVKWKEDKIYADDVFLTDKVKTKGINQMILFGVASTLCYPNMFYFCKLWNPDNGELVRDFIPVLDWDYVPCLYDKVSGQLFYNQGSGDFLYGREIHYVDYLEADGTQYIDTGVKVTANTKAVLDFQMTDVTSGTNGILGASTGETLQFITQTNQSAFTFQWTPNTIQYVGTKDLNKNVFTIDIPNRIVGVSGANVSISSFTLSMPTGNVMLFANGHLSVKGRMKAYNYTQYDLSAKVLDMYPAIDENGVGFMFDKVSHTIYDNAGTGVFKYPARETEYTANAGTLAYIDLGVKYKPSMTIEGKYTRNSYGTQGSVILVTTTTTPPLIYMPALSGTSTERFVWRRGGYTEQNYIISGIQYPFTAEIKIDAVNDTLTVNNEVVKTGMIAGMNGYDSPYESYLNMYIFSIAGSYAGDGKIYYLKITDGTTPLFDLIPAYKDGEAGFYNKVDGVFYKNASTHSNAKLTGGKILEPEYE